MKNIPFRKVESNNYCRTSSLLNWLSQSTPFFLCAFLFSSSDFCSFLLLLLLFPVTLSLCLLSLFTVHNCAHSWCFILTVSCINREMPVSLVSAPLACLWGHFQTWSTHEIFVLLNEWIARLSHNWMTFGTDMEACPLF